MKIGMIVRSDLTGLGFQSKELTKVLNPRKVLHINSFRFNRNLQHPSWYRDYKVVSSFGFPNVSKIKEFLKGLDVVVSCETFYNDQFIDIAKSMNVKTVLQFNFEFLDYLQREDLQTPDLLIAPSPWRINEVIEKLGDRSKIALIPPPLSLDEFNENREINLQKTHYKVLHVAGRIAHLDRNGTKIVDEVRKKLNKRIEVNITIQKKPWDFLPSRSSDYLRIKNREDLYKGYDLVLLPRRYGGLCLPMNEALASALPVVMSNIEPNSKVLPEYWLVDATKQTEFMARELIEVFDIRPEDIVSKVENFYDEGSILANKIDAFELAKERYDGKKIANQFMQEIGDLVDR